MKKLTNKLSSLRLLRQCLLLGFLLTPVMAVGQEVPDFEFTLLVAESGVPEGQYNLGNMYANGRGVPEDDAEAVKWYRLAAEQGIAYAQNRLGGSYEHGEGVPQDYAVAARWFRLAADQVSNRIINEIPSISRVTYDIPIKPPATIERE